MRPLALLVPMLLACARTPPETPAAANVVQYDVTSARLPRAADAKVDVALAGPSRILYSPATMRAPRPSLRITVANPSSTEPLDVRDLRVHLEVTREGERVRCDDVSEATGRAREPLVLAPGASASFVRTVDCPLTLTGSYAARVMVSFGRVAPYSTGVVARELALTVAAPPDAQPRPIASVPGLYAAIGASGMVPSTTGRGRVVLALVNGTGERIALPPLSIGFRVRRVGSDIPCEDEPVRLSLPSTLEPGAVITRPVEVSCLGLGTTGRYDVEAHLFASDRVCPVGSLRLDVTTDPSQMYRRLIP